MAERAAGALLAKMELPGRGGGDTRASDTMSLDSLGIDKKQSSRWQQEAQMPDSRYGGRRSSWRLKRVWKSTLTSMAKGSHCGGGVHFPADRFNGSRDYRYGAK